MLAIDPPKKLGEPVDLKQAAKQKRTLARLYHPDASGREDTRGAYEQVIKAYEALEEYNEQLTGPSQSTGPGVQSKGSNQ